MSNIPEDRRYTYEQMEHWPEGFCYLDGYDHAPVGAEYVLFTDHQQAVAEAVAAEREACAQSVDSLGDDFRNQNADWCDGVNDALAAIRARADQAPGSPTNEDATP